MEDFQNVEARSTIRPNQANFMACAPETEHPMPWILFINTPVTVTREQKPRDDTSGNNNGRPKQ